MNFRFKLLLISIATPFLLFPSLAILFGEDSLNIFLVPVSLSFFFMIFSLIFYKMDSRNNKKILEEYNKENDVHGSDILDSIVKKQQKKFPFLSNKRLKIKPFSELSFTSKIFRVINILVVLFTFFSSFYFGFNSLINDELKYEQSGRGEINKFNFSNEFMDYSDNK